VGEHGAVLGPPDDATERDVGLALEQRAGEVLDPRGAGERVGIWIVMRQDDERPGTIERVHQARHIAAARGCGHAAVSGSLWHPSATLSISPSEERAGPPAGRSPRPGD